MILAHIAHAASSIHASASLAMFQEAASFSLTDMWSKMTWIPRGIVIILFIMSIWSLAVMIDRAIYFSAARTQSREFAPKVAGALKNGNLWMRPSRSPTRPRSRTSRKSSPPACRSSAPSVPAEPSRMSRSSPRKRALERSEAIVHSKLKRGLGGLATIGSTAPFIGLLGTVIGILNAFQSIASSKATGIGAVAGGISEALVTTAFGLIVAIPAVMAFNYFTNKVEAFDVEMDNSSSELVDYFIKQSHR